MSKKYYLDASIWMDIYEDRKGYQGEPLGKFAAKFLLDLLKEGARLVISDVLVYELEVYYSSEEINAMFVPFSSVTEKIRTAKEQYIESKEIAKVRDLPQGDVLHAIIARDHNLILVGRDNHFMRLKDICKCVKPEELFQT